MGIHERVPTPDYVTQVEFYLSDPTYPFVAASRVDDCRVLLDGIVPRSTDTYAEFFTVLGAAPDSVLELMSDHVNVEPRLLNRYEDGGLFEFLVDGNCPVLFLGTQRALPQDVFAVGGEGYIVAEIPSSENAGEVVDRFLDVHPDAELVAKRDQPHVTPMVGHREYRQLIDEHLTPRENEVLTAAHESGYYGWPREVTAEELAEELGISSATLLKHLRAAERKLTSVLFDELDGSSAGGRGDAPV